MRNNKVAIWLMVGGFVFAGSSVHAQMAEPPVQSTVQPSEVQVKVEQKQECKCGPGLVHKRIMWKLAYKLALSDDQAKQLGEYLQKQRESMKASFGQMRSTREALEQELSKAALDMDKINQLHVQLKTIQTQMADAHLNAALEARKILSPEQYNKFVELVRERQPWGQRVSGRFEENERWQHRRHHYNDDDGDDYGCRHRRPHHDEDDEDDSFDDE